MSNSDKEAAPVDPVPLGEFQKRSAHLSGWPEPIHDVLNTLVDSTAALEPPTTRAELAAALVLDAYRDKSAAELKRILALYRGALIAYTEADEH